MFLLSFLLAKNEPGAGRSFKCIEDVMAKKQEPKWNIEDLTEAEIYAAIRYLEHGVTNTELGPDARSTTDKQDDVAALAISVIFIVLMAGVGFMLLYWR
jgi:hypothetical protein